MIHGMARAGARVRPRRTGSPRRAARWTSCAPRCGATAACWRPTRTAARISNAYLDDHAFLLAALLEMHAGGLPRRRSRLRDRARRRAARASSRTRARRLLLHQPRPRAADPAAQAGSRQRHALGQRRRRARAAAPRPSGRRAALSAMRRSARCGCSYPQMQQHPSGFPTLCMALAEHSTPPTVICCAAPRRSRPGDVACATLCADLLLVPDAGHRLGVDAGCRQLWTSRCGRVSTPGFAGALMSCRRSAMPALLASSMPR